MTSKRKKAPAPAPTTITLHDLAERWLAHLDDAGKSSSTMATYQRELDRALAALGETTPLAELAPDAVAAYFESDAVTRTATGQPKGQPTVALTRRVLRMTLVWAEEQKLVAIAPLPTPKP